MRCPCCNSENVVEGRLQGYSGIVFVEKGTENKLRPNAYKTVCMACTDCGNIFDLKIVTTGKRKVGNQEPAFR